MTYYRLLALAAVFCFSFAASTLAQTVGTQTIAHRGDWMPKGSAQNSRASLRRALDLGIFGSEIDIWLTRDGHIMVNHDRTFQGITPEDTTYAACKKLKLKNGERMPQLEDLLGILRKSKSPTRLVVEVKDHRLPQRSRDCAAAAVAAIRKYGLEDRVLYISFSIEACETLHQLAPQADVAYLSGNRAPKELHAMGLTGIDYHIKVFRQHPEWVAEAHALGMNVNVWTVDEAEDIRAMQQLGVDYITTNKPTLCEEVVRLRRLSEE